MSETNLDPLQGAADDPRLPSFYLRPDLDGLLRNWRAATPVRCIAPGEWAVSRYTSIARISRDQASFTSTRGVIVNDPLRIGRETGPPTLLQMDNPTHASYRRLFGEAFSASSIERFEGLFRAAVQRCLDAVPCDEPFDAVSQISVPLSTTLVSDLLGFDEHDDGLICGWTDAAVRLADRFSVRDAYSLVQMMRLLESRAGAAESGSLLGSLACATIGDRTVTRAECVALASMLIFAGCDTTRNLVSGALHAFCEHPDQWVSLAVLGEQGTLGRAADELIRWITPVNGFARTVTKPVVVDGVELTEGDYVLLLYLSANRDEEVWGSTAAELDVMRDERVPHLAFGVGPHACLGAGFARMQLRVLLQELLLRFECPRLAAPAERVGSTLMHGMQRLPIVFELRRSYARLSARCV